MLGSAGERDSVPQARGPRDSHLEMYLITTVCSPASRLWSTTSCTMPVSLRLSVRSGVNLTAFICGVRAEEALRCCSQLEASQLLSAIEMLLLLSSIVLNGGAAGRAR